jgi:HSP20 family protein
VYGKFEREFTLPADLDADRVKAQYRDGVLELTLPIKESAKPRRIEISTMPEMKQVKMA